jgi:hypothetical protein
MEHTEVLHKMSQSWFWSGETEQRKPHGGPSWKTA